MIKLLIFAIALRSAPHFRLMRGSLINPETQPPSKLPPVMKRKSLLDLPAVEAFAHSQNLTEQHVATLYNIFLRENKGGCGRTRLSTKNVPTIDKLTSMSFPRHAADQLQSEFVAMTSSIKKVVRSESGGFRLLISLPGGEVTETVLIKHVHKNGKTRFTACLSSQVGCRRGCTFCATGTLGMRLDLDHSVILEQFAQCVRVLDNEGLDSSALKNVVYMGQGEPLDNYANVIHSIRGLSHQALFAISPSKITLSTVAPEPSLIKRLAEEAPKVNLAVSLHGATQELRERTVPSARATTISELGEALDFHAKKSSRGSMLEYLLIDDVNDSEEAALQLVEFYRRRNKNHPPFVNLIPYNPTAAGDRFGYTTPLDDKINAFRDILKAEGVPSNVRWSSAGGRDALGACGQLSLGE